MRILTEGQDHPQLSLGVYVSAGESYVGAAVESRCWWWRRGCDCDTGISPLLPLEVRLALAPVWTSAFYVGSHNDGLTERPHTVQWPDDVGELGFDEPERYWTETIAVFCAEGLIS